MQVAIWCNWNSYNTITMHHITFLLHFTPFKLLHYILICHHKDYYMTFPHKMTFSSLNVLNKMATLCNALCGWTPCDRSNVVELTQNILGCIFFDSEYLSQIWQYTELYSSICGPFFGFFHPLKNPLHYCYILLLHPHFNPSSYLVMKTIQYLKK